MSGEGPTDARFGIPDIMRPINNFDTVLEGVSAVNGSFGLFPSADGPGRPLDEAAESGQDGYDPTLIRAARVPYGSRVVVWVPHLYYQDSAETLAPYTWVFIWRLRNLFDFRNFRKPYHFPKQTPGVPVGGATRLIIPAANQSVVYSREEPDPAVNARAVQLLITESYQCAGQAAKRPWLDAGVTNGKIEQGFGLPNVFPNQEPTWEVHEMQAVGDELIVYIDRATTAELGLTNWNFAGLNARDAQLATFFNSSTAAGLYIFRGSAP
jgi:hypothetical protein